MSTGQHSQVAPKKVTTLGGTNHIGAATDNDENPSHPAPKARNFLRAWFIPTSTAGIVLWLAILIQVALLRYPQPPVGNLLEDVALPLATKYRQQWMTHSPPRSEATPLQNIRVLVTGPTSGIGKEATKILYQLGADIVAVGRSEAKLHALRYELEQMHEDPSSSSHIPKFDYFVTDFADLESVSNASLGILRKYENIDILIANAGVHYHWTTFSSPTTKQGIDLVFGVNYLSHYLLVEKLLPLVANNSENGRSKILFLNSFFHFSVDGSGLIGPADGVPPQWIFPQKEPCPHRMYRDQYNYASSKFSLALYAHSLQRRFPLEKTNLAIVSIDPGWTATNLNGPKGAALHEPMQWMGFPVKGWGMMSFLHGLFLDEQDSQEAAASDKFHHHYWSNADNYLLLPKILNSDEISTGTDLTVVSSSDNLSFFSSGIAKTLQARDAFMIVVGFLLGFSQRFYYHAVSSSPALETYDQSLQKKVDEWSRAMVREHL